MTNIVLVGLAVLGVLGLFACVSNSKTDDMRAEHENPAYTQLKENPYQHLRALAINATAKQLQLDSIGANEVYGVVMDWNLENVIVTVVSFSTGEASVYLSSGQGFIGGYAHENIKKAARAFTSLGQKYISKSAKTDHTEPSNGAKVDFYLLTNTGKYYLEDDYTSIENGKSELSNLFIAGNAVITEYRTIDEQ